MGKNSFEFSSLFDFTKAATHSAAATDLIQLTGIQSTTSVWLHSGCRLHACTCVRLCVRACLTQTVNPTNLPAQTFSSPRRLLSSSWFMTLIKTPLHVCPWVCVCVRACTLSLTMDSVHNLSLLQWLTMAVRCGCDSFSKCPCHAGDLHRGRLLVGRLFVENKLLDAPSGGRCVKTTQLLHSHDGGRKHWGVCGDKWKTAHKDLEVKRWQIILQ